MRFVGVSAAHAAFILFVLGLALRLTVGDKFERPAALFYATPWPILAVLPLGQVILWLKRGRKDAAAVFLVLALGCMVTWLSGSHFRSRSTTEPGNFRVLFWNAQRPKDDVFSAIEKVRSTNADLIGIAEYQSRKRSHRETWRAAFPSYSMHTLSGELLFLSRGKSTLVKSGQLAPGSHFHVLKAQIRRAETIVILVDLNGVPHRSRRPDFERLNELLAEYAGKDVILMGDFNTPRESVFFTGVRQTMKHAFETAGSGMAETWPVPLPVLSLDHVWTRGRIEVAGCRHGWWFGSDHRPVMVDLRLPQKRRPQLSSCR